MRGTLSLGAIALVLLGACGERGAETTPDAALPSAVASETEAGLCREHGVLEVVCPRCNPKLAPVFQAKGDWCAEHGLPESFCPLCHPERGGRPAAAPTIDEAPAHGTKVRFRTPQTAAIAGIETEPAVERPSDAGVVAVARLVYDATRVAGVNARSPGVIRAMHVDVGTRVRRGMPLAEIESAALGADQSKLAAARARTAVAEAAHQRTRDLLDRGIVPANDLLLAEQELQAAKAEQEAAEKALHVVGPHGEDATYTLVAPLDGIVTERRSTVGTLVDIEEMLFEIVDPTSMWAEIDVPEVELAVVAPGQRVVLSLDALPGRPIHATIDYIAPAIDPRTRTALARARVLNRDGTLRAQMYGRARIQVGDARRAVVVPRAAVQQARGVAVVFVRLAVDLYETRRVRVVASEGGQVELAEGVRPGESVVTQGSFLLKTETLKGSIGAGCCDPLAGK